MRSRGLQRAHSKRAPAALLRSCPSPSTRLHPAVAVSWLASFLDFLLVCVHLGKRLIGNGHLIFFGPDPVSIVKNDSRFALAINTDQGTFNLSQFLIFQSCQRISYFRHGSHVIKLSQLTQNFPPESSRVWLSPTGASRFSPAPASSRRST